MLYPCEVKQQSAQPVLSIRTHTAVQDLPRLIGESYGQVMQCLGEMGEQPAGAPFVAYYNMDMQNLDIEIGFPVARPLPGKGPVQPGMIPAGMVATCMYTGPYDKMEPAYQQLTAWIQEKGYEPTGIVYEFYLNDPAATPPEELLTQIVFLLKN
jgi:effector-binding domain-containing protein